MDIGCGPGNSTELLVARYPEAEIIGLDNSPAMLEEARRRLPQVRFELANADVWLPDADVDLVFANAIYQWVPRHLEHLPRVLAALPAGATLAVQMPDNLAEPTHRLMRDVAVAGPWSDVSPARRVLRCRRRAPITRRCGPWPRGSISGALPTTTRSVRRRAIVEFVRSTGLRPFLDPLTEAERKEFIAIYTAQIAAAYSPLAAGGVLLAFPRLFLVAERKVP